MKKIICLAIMLVAFSTILFGCGGQPELLNTYNLVLEYNSQEGTLSGSMNFNYINNEETSLNNLCFHLYPNAFRENSKQNVVGLTSYNNAYYSGKSYGDIEILNTGEYSFEYVGDDNNILKINLNKDLSPNETMDLQIDYKVTMPKINHRFGIGENTINFGNCYPVLCVFENGQFDLRGYHSSGDPFYSEVANYNIEIKYSSDLTLAHSGEKTKEEILEKNKKTNIKACKIRDFCFVLSDKFQVISEKVEGVTVNYYYYSDKSPNESLKTSAKCVLTFNNLFGKYPYNVLNVVESSFVHGGMEYPNLVLISDSLPDYETYTMVIIHEIAHQWWYGVVGNDQYSYGWLDEGLTEFSVALFYEKNSGYNMTKDNMVLKNQNNFKIFEKIYTSVLGKVDTSFNRELNDFENEQEYVYTAYVKAFLMHDSLYELLGEKAYIKALKLYLKNNAFKTARPEDLLYAFEKSTGKDLESFFNSWMNNNVSVL